MTTEINPLTATNKDSSSSPVIGTKRAEINGSAVEEWGIDCSGVNCLEEEWSAGTNTVRKYFGIMLSEAKPPNI